MAANKTLSQIMDEWNRDSGCLVAQEGRRNSELRQIPFSSPTANYMTYNGIPRGKVTEFFGPESSGKTTSALDIVSNAQKLFATEYEQEKSEIEDQLNGLKLSAKKRQELNNRLEKLSPMKIIYLDLENTLDADWAELLGVDMSHIITITPEADSAEKILQYILDMVDTGEVGLVVLDSIPCLVPQVIFEESMEKKSYGGAAGPLSVFCSRVNAYLNRSDTTMIFINQEREDMNSTYSTYLTPGGKALKHLYSVRIRFRKGSFVDDRNNEVPSRTVNPAGNIVNMEIIKSKAFKPNRRIGSYTLKYCEGIDVLADLVSLGLAFGIVLQSGAWFSVVDSATGEILADPDGVEIKSQGMAKFLAMLKEDDYVRDILTDGVMNIIHDS